jgi:4-hydroxymandelate oxidase
MSVRDGSYIPDAPQRDSTDSDGRTIVRSMSLVNLAEYEAAAREAVAGSTLDYFEGGSNDEITLRDNVAAFSRITLYPRMFRGVGRRDTSTTLVGSGARWPVIVAPVALLGMLSPDGEVPAVRAATAAGSIFVLSSLSVTPVEDVIAVATGPVWFQLYVYKDRAASEALVKRAELAGCSALELTADTPILGRRERYVRNSFALPEGLWTPNLTADAPSPLPESRSDSPFKAAIDALFYPNLTWDDVRSKSGRRRTWSSSARGAGPRASRRSFRRRSSWSGSRRRVLINPRPCQGFAHSSRGLMVARVVG